jgi:rfaE bifunctional protein nucleotidyltransferase chain/domain
MNFIELLNSKIVDKEQLSPLLTYWRFKNQKIVFTNGCFDVLHKGHIEYLAKAASLGDVLIVGLNTDNSVRRIKGSERPVQDESSRAMILASLRLITSVVLFDEDTPYELIKLVKPDILVKGSDYKEDEIVGSDIVKAKGGEIFSVELTEGYSTSKLIEKIKNS